jgi:hypothetical protein
MLPCRATASKTFRSIAFIVTPIFGINTLERMVVEAAVGKKRGRPVVEPTTPPPRPTF